MSRVYHRKKVSYSTFRKIPYRAAFWGDTTTAQPLYKMSRNAFALSRDTTEHYATPSAVSPTTGEVVRVPEVWLRHR
jgi:hypothetical protein